MYVNPSAVVKKKEVRFLSNPLDVYSFPSLLSFIGLISGCYLRKFGNNLGSQVRGKRDGHSMRGCINEVQINVSKWGNFSGLCVRSAKMICTDFFFVSLGQGNNGCYAPLSAFGCNINSAFLPGSVPFKVSPEFHVRL